MNNLEQVMQKLSEIAAMVESMRGVGGLPPPPAYETPELPAPSSEAELGEHKVRADGSTWVRDNNGKPMQLIYGYISEGKNPAMYGRMLALAGSRERLEYALGTNRMARYKVHPDSHLLAGDPNWIMLSSTLAAVVDFEAPNV